MKTSKADVLVIGGRPTGMTFVTLIISSVQTLEAMKVDQVETLDSLLETRLHS